MKLIQKYFVSSKDYDLQQLTLHEWVAVAFDDYFYVGQIQKLTAKKVTVNFLTEVDGVFRWPTRKDEAQIGPKFIFSRNVQVTKNKADTTFSIINLKGLREKFTAFFNTYFK